MRSLRSPRAILQGLCAVPTPMDRPVREVPDVLHPSLVHAPVAPASSHPLPTTLVLAIATATVAEPARRRPPALARRPRSRPPPIVAPRPANVACHPRHSDQTSWPARAAGGADVVAANGAVRRRWASNVSWQRVRGWQPGAGPVRRLQRQVQRRLELDGGRIRLRLPRRRLPASRRARRPPMLAPCNVPSRRFRPRWNSTPA